MGTLNGRWVISEAVIGKLAFRLSMQLAMETGAFKPFLRGAVLAVVLMTGREV